MIMETYKNFEELMRKEIIEVVEHFESCGYIDEEKADALCYDKQLGCGYINPTPILYTEYICYGCKQWFKHEFETDGFDHYCNLCLDLKEGGLL